MVLMMALHLIREMVMGRFRRARLYSWISGATLVPMVFLSGIIGFWLVWDKLGQFTAVRTAEWLDWLPIFAAPMARNFLLNPDVTDLFFRLLIVMHIGLPLFLLVCMLLPAAAARAAKTPKRTCRIYVSNSKKSGSRVLCLKRCPSWTYSVRMQGQRDRFCMPRHVFGSAGKRDAFVRNNMGGAKSQVRRAGSKPGRKYSSTGSGAYVGDDPARNVQASCRGPKRITFGTVVDDQGRFLGYDRSTIEKAVQRGDITAQEAAGMTISPVSKRRRADGTAYYTDSRTGRVVDPGSLK